MSWEDVYFSLNVDPKDIIKALAQIFEIEEDTIVIEYGQGSHARLDDDRIQFFCRLDIVRGDFPIRLQIELWQPELWPKLSEHYHVIGRLCDLLQSSALVTSEVSSIWTFIRGEGNYQYVMMDKDKLEAEDEEMEIADYLYRFNQRLSHLEIELGNLITCKDFDIEDYLREFFTSILNDNPKSHLLPVLNNLRLEATRMGRQEFLQDAIDWLEKSSHKS